MKLNINKILKLLLISIIVFFSFSIINSQAQNKPNSNQDYQGFHIEGSSKSKKYSKRNIKDSDFVTIEWLDLMPKENIDALMSPPDYVNEVEEGIFEDEVSSILKNLPQSVQDDYQRALTSTDVIAEINNKAIRIPGFVVPIEFDGGEKINQFFLVPYFGACIHLPPPPPNQIIFVTSDKSFEIKDLLDPYWISGIIKTISAENDIALAAYSMKMKDFEKYSEN